MKKSQRNIQFYTTEFVKQNTSNNIFHKNCFNSNNDIKYIPS